VSNVNAVRVTATLLIFLFLPAVTGAVVSDIRTEGGIGYPGQTLWFNVTFTSSGVAPLNVSYNTELLPQKVLFNGVEQKIGYSASFTSEMRRGTNRLSFEFYVPPDAVATSYHLVITLSYEGKKVRVVGAGGGGYIILPNGSRIEGGLEPGVYTPEGYQPFSKVELTPTPMPVPTSVPMPTPVERLMVTPAPLPTEPVGKGSVSASRATPGFEGIIAVGVLVVAYLLRKV